MVLLFNREEPFVQFGRRHHEEKFCEVILNIWTSGSGGDVVKIYFLSRAPAILLSI